MKKWMITFTATSKNEVFPAVVLNISSHGVTINYPKNSPIEVEPLPEHTHFDLAFKLPSSQEEYHFINKDGQMHNICPLDQP